MPAPIWAISGAAPSSRCRASNGRHLASLALTRGQQYRYVILPQSVRIALPPTVGFLVQLVKNTSIVSIVSVVELTRAGQLVNNVTFQPFKVFVIVARDLSGDLLSDVSRQPPPGERDSVSIVVVDNVRKSFVRHEVLKGVSLTVERGPGGRARRSKRLGKEHAVALPQRAGNYRQRPHRGRRASHGLPPGEITRAAPGRWHRFPELQPFPASYGWLRTSCSRRDWSKGARGWKARRTGRAGAGPRSGSSKRSMPIPIAFRRSAATGGDRALARDAAARDAL